MSRTRISSPPASPRVLPDGEARRRIREDLETTFVVEAAAGTGKTTELVARIVALLASGRAKLDEVVAVTFTEKAAGEMKLRLRAGIERTRTDPEVSPAVRDNLDRSLAMLEAARIGTIHSLCSDLLHENPLEAEVDPLFEVGGEEEAERLFDQAFERWFQTTLADPPEGVRRMLRRRPRGRDRTPPREILRDAAFRLVERRDFDGTWRRAPWDRAAALSQVLDKLRAAAGVANPRPASERDFIGRNLEKLGRFLAELDRREAAAHKRDEDGLEAELREVQRWSEWRWRGGGFSCLVPRNDAIALRDGAKRAIDGFLDAASADLAACLFAELVPLIGQYESLKKRAGRLDFLDLLLATRKLLRENAEVRQALSTRFSHLFIDEFQDTDPLQAEILLLLAADDPAASCLADVRPRPGKLFVVGDPKQSIYRFRRADVAFYSEVKAQLLGAGAEVLYLSTSFRSAPSIQHAVNAAFRPLMRGDSHSQARYVPLEPHRREATERPTIIALPVPKPYSDYGKIVGFRIEESTPEAVAAMVEHLVDPRAGWTVSERDRPDERVPLAARHVCLLFKRFQSYGDDMTRPYVRALETRRIPHVLVGGRSFHEREEIIALRSALAAIEWPDDELSVFATLRGPFFAMGDDLLIAYRAAHKALHPLAALALVDPHKPAETTALPAHEREVAEALAVLGRLHVNRNRRPIADTVGRFLEQTRAHAGLAIWPTGEQALANVLRVMDLARRFETRAATSFRAFVQRVQGDAEHGEAAEAPVVEEGTDGVRLMTVHRAKGLEFPVVVLCDPTAPHTHAQPTRFVDSSTGHWFEPLAGNMPIELFERREEMLARDLEEAHRLAYVAATRARDLLIVPVVGDASIGDDAIKGWVDVLHPVLYPPRDERRDPLPAPGCPPFPGNDTVLDRSKVEIGPEASVAPGLHHPQVGEHTVVWWDPRALPLDRERSAGLRQQRILKADERGTKNDGGELRHAAWRARRQQSIERGSKPSQQVRTATEIASEINEALRADPSSAPLPLPVAMEARTIAHERTGVTRQGRPRGKRFGILVHAMLAELELTAAEPEARAMASVQGRLVGATIDEVRAATAAVVAALAHPLMVRAARALKRGECRRETPVMMPLDAGAVLDGVIDLAFREDTPDGPRWTVIDFKTDADVAAHGAQYEAQVSLYVDAIEKATGEPASAVLLSV